MNSLEARVSKLEQEVARLKKRAASFSPPSGPAEVAMALMTMAGGELVNPEEFFWHYEAVGWKRGRQKLANWKALLVTWILRAQGALDNDANSWED